MLTTTLRNELAKLDPAGILELLGEIVEPSIKSPFDAAAFSDDFDDALHPVKCTYIDAYDALVAASSPALDREMSA